MKNKIIYFIIITTLSIVGAYWLLGGKFLPLLVVTSISTLISIWIIGDDIEESFDFVTWLLGWLFAVCALLLFIVLSRFVTINVSNGTGRIDNIYYQSGHRPTTIVSNGKSTIIMPGGDYTNYYADFTSPEYGSQNAEINGTQYSTLHNYQHVIVVKKIDILGNVHYKIKN